MTKISVIIPVYKTEKYLANCLDSVLNQTFNDLEIICVNDGSPDNSAQILQEYAQKDPRIKVLTQENQGLSAARNTGLDVATGQKIMFLDSDDAIPPYAIKLLNDIADETGAQIVASRGRLKMGEKQNLPTNYMQSIKIGNGLPDFAEDPKIFSSAWNKLFSAELFKSQRFVKGMLFEDWPIMTILFGRTDKYVTTDIPCYIYREDNISITRSSFSIRKVESYIQGIRTVFEAFKDSKQLIYARKRMAIAFKILVNKVYRAKDKELTSLLLKETNALYSDNILSKKDLFLKTRWRLWRLKHQ